MVGVVATSVSVLSGSEFKGGKREGRKEGRRKEEEEGRRRKRRRRIRDIGGFYGLGFLRILSGFLERFL